MDHVLKVTTEYRIKHGELAYRRRFSDLSDTGRNIVYMAEAGLDPNEVIGSLAWLYTSPGQSPTPAEERIAEVVFAETLREIRQVFERI